MRQPTGVASSQCGCETVTLARDSKTLDPGEAHPMTTELQWILQMKDRKLRESQLLDIVRHHQTCRFPSFTQ